MSIRLVVRKTATVTVRGKINDEDGRSQAFDFVLLCTRLEQKEIDELMEKNERRTDDFVKSVATGWRGVCDADGQTIPFSMEALDMLLNQIGMANVCCAAYVKEVGAKEKN